MTKTKNKKNNMIDGKVKDTAKMVKGGRGQIFLMKLDGLRTELKKARKKLNEIEKDGKNNFSLDNTININIEKKVAKLVLAKLNANVKDLAVLQQIAFKENQWAQITDIVFGTTADNLEELKDKVKNKLEELNRTSRNGFQMEFKKAEARFNKVTKSLQDLLDLYRTSTY